MSTLDVLTPEQAAEALGCEPQHVNELAAQRKLPAVKYGRSWRFPVAAMNQFLAQRALEHIAAAAAAAPSPTPMPKPTTRRRALPDLSKC
ncbi:MAG: helix-turn-helix domain-containing protein [Burkholderiaceae bacterium]|nr:helix-turn-helix domain-containing protein [Burkholderiaceae bacterium]